MTLYVARSRELVELVVLALLQEHPRHPYDMLRQLKVRGNTAFVPGLPRSLYHAVDQPVDGGFVEAGETVREGARPERTVFAITEEGSAEYVFRLQALLSQPSDAATFHAALSMIGGLEPATVLRSLRVRAAAVEGEAAKLEISLAGAAEQVPRLYLVELEYLRNQLQAEARWIRSVVEDIEAGRLVWPSRDAPGEPGAGQGDEAPA
jgi:DNA-binding PadR family transcriptional regulator